MTFHRLLTQDERSSDLAVALRERDQAEDFYLALGQTCKRTPYQTTRRVSQANCPPRLRHRQRAGKTFDAKHGRQKVSCFAGKFEALRKSGACPSGIPLSQRMLRKKIQRPDHSTTDAQPTAELQALLQP